MLVDLLVVFLLFFYFFPFPWNTFYVCKGISPKLVVGCSVLGLVFLSLVM